MPDSFFERKRKRPTSGGASSSRAPLNGKGKGKAVDAPPATNGKRRHVASDSHDVSASDDGDDVGNMDLRHDYETSLRSEDEDGVDETPAEARVRLARLYVDGLRRDDIDPNDADAAAADEANIAARLGASATAQGTHLHLRLASRLAAPSSESILAVRGHSSAVTAAVVAPRGDSLFTCAKDGSIFRWSLIDGRLVARAAMRARATADDEAEYTVRLRKSNSSGAARRRRRRATGGMEARVELREGEEQGHTDQLFALAISDDGTTLASGGADRRVGLWAVDTAGMKWSAGLAGHKGAVTSLSFRSGTTQLFSASTDRTLKLWDASQRSYIETLFGHQEPAQSVDALRGELAASAGGRDRTIRWWKVTEESQLVFRAGARSRVREVLEGGDWEKAGADEGEATVEGSVDVVAMVDEHSFVSGGDSGALSLWSLSKKKPVYTRPAAHGFDTLPSGGTSSGTAPSPRAITAVACLAYADVFASGSWDGSVRVWGIDAALRTFRPLFGVAAPGFVNSLQLVRPKVVPVPAQWRRRGGLAGSTGRVASSVVAEGAAAVSDSDSASEDDAPAPISSEQRSKAERAPLLIVALGREPRMGRWNKLTAAVKNGALVVPLTLLPAPADK